MATRRNLSLAAALVALVALVAIASRAHAPAGGGGGTHGLNSKLIWEFVLVGVLALFILCVPVALWVIVSSRGERMLAKQTKQRNQLWRIVAGFAIVMLAIAVASRFHGTHHHTGKSAKPSPFL